MLERVVDQPAIYTISNRLNGKVYVGSAVRPNNRRMWHLRYLRRGTHPNPHLQRAWNRYGETAFCFEVREHVPDPFWLRAREQAWISRLVTGNPLRGYNRVLDAFGGLLTAEARVHHQTRVVDAMAAPAVRQRLSLAQKLRWHTPASRKEAMAAVHSSDACAARSVAATQWLNDPARNQAHRRAISDPDVQARKGASLRETNKRPEVQATRSTAQQARREREHAALSTEALAERNRRNREAKTERQRRARAAKREGMTHAEHQG